MHSSRADVANQSSLLPPSVRRTPTKRRRLDSLWWCAAVSAQSSDIEKHEMQCPGLQAEDDTCAKRKSWGGGATPQRWLRQQ